MKLVRVLRNAIEQPNRAILRKDPFGKVILLKRMLIGALGVITYPRYNLINRLEISGTEHLANLPNQNVLFLSNHQTYFADVIAFYHIFCSVKWGYRDSIRNPVYLLAPRVNSYFVAAEETMLRGGWLPKILTYAGAVTVQRTWRDRGQQIQRKVDDNAVPKIATALQQGWVVSFPQGTTSAYAPLRRGTAYLIRDLQPIVVPVVIDGFRRAFDKKGVKLKKRGVTLRVRFKEPISFPPEMTPQEILDHVRFAIEQDRDFPFPWDSK